MEAEGTISPRTAQFIIVLKVDMELLRKGVNQGFKWSKIHYETFTGDQLLPLFPPDWRFSLVMFSSLSFKTNPLSVVKSNSCWFLTICRASSTSAKLLFLDQSRTSIGLTPAFNIAGAEICRLHRQSQRNILKCWNDPTFIPLYVARWEYRQASEPSSQSAHLLVLVFTVHSWTVYLGRSCWPARITVKLSAHRHFCDVVK